MWKGGAALLQSEWPGKAPLRLWHWAAIWMLSERQAQEETAIPRELVPNARSNLACLNKQSSVNGRQWMKRAAGAGGQGRGQGPDYAVWAGSNGKLYRSLAALWIKLQDGKDVSGETLMPRWEKMKSHRKAKSKKRRQQRGHGSTHRDMNRNHWRKILEGKKWSGVKCSLSSHMRTEGCSTKRNIPETLKSSGMTGAEAKME